MEIAYDEQGLVPVVVQDWRTGEVLTLAYANAEAVVRTTVYVVTMRRADLTTAWDVVRASPYAPAASTLLGVALLGYEGQLVEIEATAVV